MVTVSNGKSEAVDVLSGITNGGQFVIDGSKPFSVLAEIEGTAPFLMHRWDNQEVEAKGKASKGSDTKKTDNIESYCWRNSDGLLCVPGEHFRMSVVSAAKFKQDPRSPRKSASDLMKAAFIVEDELCPFLPHTNGWDYVDARRVRIQQSAITRRRPAMNKGWVTQVQFSVILPEYVSPQFLHELITMAGKVSGVGDFRPTFGRFQINGWKVLTDI